MIELFMGCFLFHYSPMVSVSGLMMQSMFVAVFFAFAISFCWNCKFICEEPVKLSCSVLHNLF